jgi:hypothetical protein
VRLTVRFYRAAAVLVVAAGVSAGVLTAGCGTAAWHAGDPRPAATATPAAAVSGGPLTIGGCPSEDSCTVSYRDGVWTITPVIP